MVERKGYYKFDLEVPRLIVSKKVVEYFRSKHHLGNDVKSNPIHSDTSVTYTKLGNLQEYKADIKFIYRKDLRGSFRWVVAALSGDYGFNLCLPQRFQMSKRVKLQILTKMVHRIEAYIRYI